jgi:uncharacterized protein
MPTLAVIGDIHAHFRNLDQVLDKLERLDALDGVLLVGDVAQNPEWHRRNHPAELVGMQVSFDQILRRVRTRLDVPVLFVPGNHDPKDMPLWGNTDRRVSKIAGLSVYGVGGAGPDLFGLPYEWEESEIRALTVPSVDILLCHSPPAGTALDALITDGRHVGSAAIRDLAEAHAGLLVCGHIHEGAGAELLGRCLCLNVGGLGEPHGHPRVGVVHIEMAQGEGTIEAVLHDLEAGTHQTWTHRYSRD